MAGDSLVKGCHGFWVLRGCTNTVATKKLDGCWVLFGKVRLVGGGPGACSSMGDVGQPRERAGWVLCVACPLSCDHCKSTWHESSAVQGRYSALQGWAGCGFRFCWLVVGSFRTPAPRARLPGMGVADHLLMSW